MQKRTHLPVLLATGAVLAAMSSVAQAATVTIVPSLPSTPAATPVVFPGVFFPGATSITANSPAGAVVSSTTTLLNSNGGSVSGNGGVTLSELTIDAPRGWHLRIFISGSVEF